MKSVMTLAATAALLCVGPVQAQPQERGAPPPSGDYWSTCRNVSTYGYGPNATMTAQCRDDRGRWRQTSLRFASCRTIVNDNGQLACDNYGRPPGGGGRPPWGGGGGGGRGGLTLFSAPGFQGQAFDTRQEYSNLPRQYNDRAMSLRIEGRGSWQVCTDSDFRGRCQVFDRDVPDLNQYGMGQSISSMRPVGRDRW